MRHRDGVGEDKKITGTVANLFMFVDLDFCEVITIKARNIYQIEMA